NQACKVCLQTLPQPGALRPKEYVLRRLLADGASTTQFLAFLISFKSLFYRIGVKTIVRHEMRILAGDCCALQVIRHIFIGEPFPVNLPFLTGFLTFKTALKH